MYILQYIDTYILHSTVFHSCVIWNKQMYGLLCSTGTKVISKSGLVKCVLNHIPHPEYEELSLTFFIFLFQLYWGIIDRYQRDNFQSARANSVIDFWAFKIILLSGKVALISNYSSENPKPRMLKDRSGLEELFWIQARSTPRPKGKVASLPWHLSDYISALYNYFIRSI